MPLNTSVPDMGVNWPVTSLMTSCGGSGAEEGKLEPGQGNLLLGDGNSKDQHSKRSPQPLYDCPHSLFAFLFHSCILLFS